MIGFDERRLVKIKQTIQAQKAFLHRIPDPDTRERAEGHLMRLIEMRDALLIQRDEQVKIAA